MAIVKNPSESAWALPSGGKVEYDTDYEIVDKLIHELGHNMSLGHPGEQCGGRVIRKKMGVTITTQAVVDEINRCCDASPSRDDVMSYCRDRASVSEVKMHRFEECNLSTLKEFFIPSLLSGNRVDWKLIPKCR
jgi:hypothetical protein